MDFDLIGQLLLGEPLINSNFLNFVLEIFIHAVHDRYTLRRLQQLFVRGMSIIETGCILLDILMRSMHT